MQYKFIKRGSKKLLTKEVRTILARILESGLDIGEKTTAGTSFKYKSSDNFFGVSNKDVIIKFGGQCKSIRKFHLADKYYPENAVPTVVVKLAPKRFARIQPKVDTRQESVDFVERHINALTKKEAYYKFGADSHYDNIGLFKGKPAVFDW